MLEFKIYTEKKHFGILALMAKGNSQEQMSYLLMSKKFMVVTMRRSSLTQKRRCAFITIIDDET